MNVPVNDGRTAIDLRGADKADSNEAVERNGYAGFVGLLDAWGSDTTTSPWISRERH